jgi:hypothetical protein
MSLLLAMLGAVNTMAHATECARTDMGCKAIAGMAAAAAACPAHIEQRSEYSARWTDSAQNPKFSLFVWTDLKVGGGITYIGDRVEFQNAAGAYKAMRYLCDMGEDGKTVLGARVYEGRLPPK